MPLVFAAIFSSKISLRIASALQPALVVLVALSSAGPSLAVNRPVIELVEEAEERLPLQFQDKPDVEALVTAGKLSFGRGRSLTAKLDAAARALANDRIETALLLLDVFINKVDVYKKVKILPAAEANPLKQAALDIIEDLEALLP